jgi:hypothetical protein
MPEFNDLRQISESGNNAFRQGQAMTAQSQANALGQLQLQNAPQAMDRSNRLAELQLQQAEAVPQKAIDEERKKIVMTFGAGLAKKMEQAKDDAEREGIYLQGSRGLNQFLTENNLATPEQKAGVITPLEKMGGATGFMSLFSGDTTSKTDPNSVQEYKFFSNLSESEKALYLKMKRADPTLKFGDVSAQGNQMTSVATPYSVAGIDGSTQPEIQSTLSRQEADKQGAISGAKVIGESEGDKLVRAASDAPKLFDELISAIERQPATAVGRGYEKAVGFVGAGSEQEQVAIAEADTIVNQLMAFAEKLPGPASDADRIDFKGSIGAYKEPGATRAQKLAAAKQAKKLFNRLVQKYGTNLGKYTSSTGIQFEVSE